MVLQRAFSNKNKSLILLSVLITQTPMKVGLTIYFKFASSTPTDAFRPILIEEIGCDSVEGSENLKSFGKLKSLWNSIGTFRIVAWFRYCLGIVSKTLAYLTTLTFSHISDLYSSNPISESGKFLIIPRRNNCEHTGKIPRRQLDRKAWFW